MWKKGFHILSDVYFPAIALHTETNLFLIIKHVDLAVALIIINHDD